jgi:hypothetical protein
VLNQLPNTKYTLIDLDEISMQVADDLLYIQPPHTHLQVLLSTDLTHHSKVHAPQKHDAPLPRLQIKRHLRATSLAVPVLQRTRFYYVPAPGLQGLRTPASTVKFACEISSALRVSTGGVARILRLEFFARDADLVLGYGVAEVNSIVDALSFCAMFCPCVLK